MKILFAISVLLVTPLFADFEAPLDIYTGVDPKEVNLSDLNGDGRQDIVFVDNGAIKIIYQEHAVNNSYSALLDGVSHFIVPQDASLEADSFTISTWFNLQNDSGQNIYLLNTSTLEVVFLHDLQRVRFRAKGQDGSTLNFFIYDFWPTVDEWFHIAFTYNAVTGQGKAYINGQVDAVFTTTAEPFLVQATDTTLGGRNAGSLDGYMDDTAYFNAALTDGQVAEIYNYGEYVDLQNHSASDSLVSWWTMGDHEADNFSLFLGTPLLKDVAGSNDGQPVNTERDDKVEFSSSSN